MGDTLTGDLIEAELAERHDHLMTQFYRGFAGMCHALHDIREEKTYRAKGFESWTAFLDSQHISAGNGRLMANAWPVLDRLERAGLSDHVKHVDMLRPIHKIPNAAKQVAIIKTALNTAEKQLVPFTPKLIREVAEKQFGWIPESKYSKGERRRRGPPEDPREKMRDNLERAFRVIANCGISGYDLAQIFDLDELDGFRDALQMMKDAEEA